MDDPSFAAAPIAASAPVRRWAHDPAATPWFEQPDAAARIPDIAGRWKLDAQETAWLHEWVENGYFIVKRAIPPRRAARLARRAEKLWRTRRAVPDLAISDVLVGTQNHIHLQHKDLVALPKAVREEAERRSFWRVGQLHLFDKFAAKVFHDARLARLAGAICDRPARPLYSLTFAKGSQQSLHQDAAVFHLYPRNFIVGVWIALEDVKPDSGPLMYAPGSHREPWFDGFDNDPQTQVRTAPPELGKRYGNYIDAARAKYTVHEFLAEKGDALFWHGMLLHGGRPVRNPLSTRRSFVIHFIPPECDKGSEVQGPFNW